MGKQETLRCLFWLTLGYVSFCSAGVPGTEFITVFMQNHNIQTGNPDLTLSITAHYPATTVNIAINKYSFRKKITLDTMEQATIQLPNVVQMTSSKPFYYTVIVMSSSPVSVVSGNYKTESSDTASLFPVEELGTNYYIFTPSDGPEGSFKEFAVVSKEPTTVTIHLTGDVTFQDRLYVKGSKLKFSLESYEAIAFQSTDDLSGTKVEALKPVAVLSGHTCASKHTKCNHVYEQLQPVDYWGSTFIIPPSPFQTKYDLVYVTASQYTQVTYQAGSLKTTHTLNAGEDLEIQLMPSAPLFVTATEGIQVFLFSAGGRYGSMVFDTFLMSVPDVNSYCTTYLAAGQDGFNNEAIIVAKTSSLQQLTINKTPLGDVNWQEIPGTNYSWRAAHMNSNSKTSMVEDGNSTFGLTILGVASLNAYGEPGICLSGSSRPSCSKTKCKKQEMCKIIQGKATCLAKYVSECWAWGDPHYHTFDGKNYDFQGTCAYTMVQNCVSDPTIPNFRVDIKNENRGSSLVSYIRYVNLQIYDYNITSVRSEMGTVRINNQKAPLPIVLNNGAVSIFQSGSYLIIQTDFALRIFYDWNILVKINLPSNFSESVCGLCGNYNGNPNDDLYSAERVPLNPIDFGKSWKVANVISGDTCWDDCNGPCKTCPFNLKLMYGNNTQCGIVSLRNGPFRNCHSLIDPQIYKDNCVYDLCMSDGYHQVLCQALKTYSDACQRAGATVYEWRNYSRCGNLECPKNSTYNACGSSCPATCEDPQAPSKCTEPCIETCECDPGFLMIGGECLPKAYCGCKYDDRFYAPGDSFYLDTQCKKKCVCNETSHKVECSNNKCKSGEQCTLQNGLQGCYPTRYGTCSASGDPHYITYDGLHYNFQGTCEYLLSGLCSNTSGRTDFQVKVRNENRGSRVVSYTAFVSFTIFDTEIQIRREFPNQVLVNGIISNIPVTLLSGSISIFPSGRHCVIQTKIGIRVTFDWDARVQIMVPSTYANLVCGLCGNFNKNPKDDLLLANGEVTNDTVSFAQTWKVGEVQGCHEEKELGCSDLKTLEKEQRKTMEGCGILLDKNGPFRECHSRILPEDYFKDCVYDLCAFGELQDVTCRLIAGYTAACQDAKATVYPWRTEQFCPLTCPDNSHYNVCSSGCPSTCQSLTLAPNCNSACKEGCTCNTGFILSGGQCIPISQCGCLFKDRYYQLNDIFFPEDTCENRCTCTVGGTVVCSAFSCGPYEECRVEKGVQSCHPNGSSTCSAMGQSYYRTFDGLGYDIYGNCSYFLAKTCLVEGSNLIPFSLRRQNLLNSDPPSSRILTVEVYNYSISIIHDYETKIYVNGMLMTLPFNLESGKLNAIPRGLGIVLSTDFGLIADSDLMLHVTIPATYHNQTCGLCGNYNDIVEDEFVLSNGELVAFAESWIYNNSENICVTSESCLGTPQNCPVCPKSKEDKLAGEKLCGILSSSKGPFAICNPTVDPSPYLKSCVNNLCTGTGDLCLVLQTYVKQCRDDGIEIGSWRSSTFCPMSCPEHSHYKPCADLCSTSCSSMYDISSCPVSCSEGCQCDNGYFFQSGSCVLPQDCGCYYNSSYYHANQTIVSLDCSQRCNCTSGLSMACEPYGCAENEKCTIIEGTLGCINIDPCKSITCRNKESCVAQNDVPVCVPEYIGTCWQWGGTHYNTFDGYSYDFQGTCAYVLSRYIGGDTTLTYFSIEEIKDNGGTTTLSFLKLVNVFVYGFNVSLIKGDFGNVLVNEESTNLPVNLLNGKISLSLSGSSVILNTDFGLQVIYDYNEQVVVKIPSSYYGSTGGLCGNFNQQSNDEQLTLDNKMANSTIEWAESWKISGEDPFCWDTCQKNCLKCDDTKISIYKGDNYCGLIKAEDGPFRECHPKIKADVIFNNCVNDVCSKDGSQRFSCQALEVYADLCRKEGISIDNWREKSGCAFQCPKNSHYEACGNACPASCADRTAPDRCTKPCVETCQCDDGYILSAGTCVNVSSCGCSYNNKYYQPNQIFWSDDKCSIKCKCVSTLGIVSCQKTSCKAGETCSTVSGVRGCYPSHFSTCAASGDPHYITFDRKKYNFMGTCIYTFAEVCIADSSLPYFNVKIQTERRGNKKVSYAKALTLEVYNQNITLTRDHPQQVLVNGIITSIPFSFKTNKIKAFMKGEHAFVRTDFDVTMNYNWDNYARVMVPSTYAGSLCGLCGNYNNDPKDDLTPADDNQVADNIRFEDRYKVEETPGCTGDCKEDCPTCDEDKIDKYKGEMYCGILNNVKGPLRQCFTVVDPSPFFDDCVYDSCQYQGYYAVTCGAIASYVLECQSKGIKIESWRTSTFCNMSCSVNSHYELCGTGCHPTCAGLSTSVDCAKSCMEGCYCDSGFLLSADTCVPISRCGCLFQGQYYKNGQVFYPEGQCKTSCQCMDNGNVICQDMSCGPDEECNVVNGVRGCFSKKEGTCVVSANKHYLSFDGLDYNFYGTCSYTLANVCKKEPGLGNFSVILENNSIGKDKMERIRSLKVNVYEYEIIMKQGTYWKVQIHGEDHSLPLNLENGKVLISQEGSNIKLLTDFEVAVLYDSMNLVKITVPGAYQGATCGLCGDFNDQNNDEFRLPSGVLSNNLEEFGAAWSTNSDGCVNGCQENCNSCDPLRATIFARDEACGLFLLEDGPFAECKYLVNATYYFNNCLLDMCTSDGQKETLCDILQAYTVACQDAGAKIKPWRTSTFCSMSCPKNSHYDVCARTCDMTCYGITAPSFCSDACYEGCVCDDGYQFDGSHCVEMDTCGCVYNGRYLKLGSSLLSHDCSEVCLCETGGSVSCSNLTCSDEEFCGLENGARGCIKKQGSCTLSANGNLMTFDKLLAPVFPGITFDLAAVCDPSHDAWFRLVAITESCQSDTNLHVSAVHAYFVGVSIAINQFGKAWVDGRAVKLPFQDNGSLSIHSEGETLVLRRSNMMELIVNRNGELTLRVNENLAGALCGACGNFNRQKFDDLQEPGGKSITLVAKFVASWASQDFSRCEL
ncbi:c-binding -like [Pelobates cultripes]|uniref:C-binding -like n=1 Tax=Pelobates cultripes TaxID=61616 RepID=A0AAD1T439_PELCU|nr:c-binding -like [Pelobates cultripes]